MRGSFVLKLISSRKLIVSAATYALVLLGVLVLAKLRTNQIVEHTVETGNTKAYNIAQLPNKTNELIRNTDGNVEFQQAKYDSQRIGEKVKLILYWNPFFRAEDFRFGFGYDPFEEAKCSVDQCYTTKNRSLLSRADAVLTHGPLVEPALPKPRPGQRYVYVQGEPHWVTSNDMLPALRDYYNLTMTYRLDSDIRLPYALLEQDRSRVIRKSPLIDLSEKKRSVVWVVSHCDTPSKRELYVRELMKSIDVDVYGECGNLKCPKSKNAECREMFARKYYFYLSLENDVCKDYSSEKLYHPLRYNIVPVVYGGANYTHDTPPSSVINIMDYPSPKHLARHLRHMIKNKQEYRGMLDWKSKGYNIEMDRRTIMARAMCKLCHILHEPRYKFRDYTDIWKWWVDGACSQNAMVEMKTTW